MRRGPTTGQVTLAAIIVTYLGTRCFRLLTIPMFVDEAIHIEGAKVAMAGDLQMGLGWGKWLSIQSYGIVLRNAGDPLLIARLLPVALGVLTVCILYNLGRTGSDDSKNTRAALCALLYLLTPYSLFYDRLALTDQFLTVLLAAIFLFTFRIVENPDRCNKGILGVLLILSPLFKFSGALFALVPLLIVLIVSPAGQRRHRIADLRLPYAMSAPFILAFGLVYAPAGEFGKLGRDTAMDAYVLLWATNVKGTGALLWSMLTPGLVLGLIFGAIAVLLLSTQTGSKRRVLAGVAIALFLTAPYLLFFRVWFPRYLLPLMVPICLIGSEVLSFVAGFSDGERRTKSRQQAVGFSNTATEFRHAFRKLFRKLDDVWYTMLRRLAVLVILVSTGTASVRVLAAPQAFPLYKPIREQYITGWTSGYGLREIVAEIRRISIQNPGGILLVRTSKWDLPLHGIDVYYRDLGPDTKRVTLSPGTPEEIRVQLAGVLALGRKSYFLFNGAFPYAGDQEIIDEVRSHFEVIEVAHFEKPHGNPGLKLWQITERVD